MKKPQKHENLKVKSANPGAIRLSEKKGKKVSPNSVTRNHIVRTPKITRSEYILLVQEAEKFPLSARLAAELARSGVDLNYYETVLYREGTAFNRHTWEEMVRIAKGKVDIEKVPPFRPVYVQYVDPKVSKIGAVHRPSEAEVKAEMHRFISAKEESGWERVDLIRFLREVGEGEKKQAIRLKQEEKLSVAEEMLTERITARLKDRIAKLNAIIKENEKEMAELRQKASSRATIAAIKSSAVSAKQEQKKEADVCAWCKFPLNGHFMMSKPEGGQVHEPMHVGCYYMNSCKPSQLQDGLEVLSAAEGVFYKWSATAGKWCKVESTKKETDAGRPSESGVPPSGGKSEQPPTSVSVETTEGQPVHNLPEASNKVPPVSDPLPATPKTGQGKSETGKSPKGKK